MTDATAPTTGNNQALQEKYMQWMEEQNARQLITQEFTYKSTRSKDEHEGVMGIIRKLDTHA